MERSEIANGDTTSGVWLVGERLNRGLTVPALALEAGVPAHVVRHAEKGNTPSPPNALKLASYFGVQVTDIWPVIPPTPEREAA